MPRARTVTLITATLTIVFGVLGPLAAQETDTIYIANSVVARIRTAGTYSTIYARSGAIDQAIAEVISTQDTQHPQVRVAMKDGRWSVYCGGVRIISVYPEEAKANNIPAKTLAQMWAKSIKTQLPLATPKSRMGPGDVLPPVPTYTPPAAPLAEPAEAPTSTISRSAALLLTIDGFNVVRSMSEEDYLDKRENIARQLLKNLQPFMGLEDFGKPQPTVSATVTTGRETIGPPMPPAVEEPETRPDAEGLSDVGSAAVTPTVPADTTAVPPGRQDDPAYARVPQKQRIKAKFAQVQEPYLELAAADPGAAEPISKLLKTARAARAAEKFDECESLLDHVLRLLGVSTGR